MGMKKETIIGVIICLVFLAGLGVFSWYELTHDGLVHEVSRNITNEDRKVFEDRITDSLRKLEETDDNAIKFDLYSKLGYDSYTLGHLKDSRKYFEKAIEITPTEYGVHQGLFHTEIEMKDYAAAEKNIQQAIEIRPGSSNLWREYIDFKANVLNAPEDQMTLLYAEALDKTKNELTALTDITTSYATYLEKIGNLQAAKEYWQKAAEMNGDNRKAYDAEIKRLDALLKKANQ